MVLTFSLIHLGLTLSAQSPARANIIDDNGLKQGDWVYYYDENWNELREGKDAGYYRLVTYHDSQPVGQLGDYYANGQPQMLADSVINEVENLFEGRVIYYTEEGLVTFIEIFSDGSLDTTSTIDAFIAFIDQYQQTIPDHMNTSLANDVAYLFLNQERYVKAEEYYTLSRNIREIRVGNQHILFAGLRISWVMRNSNRTNTKPLYLITCRQLRFFDNWREKIPTFTSTPA